MISTLLITLREGLEAALIVVIILAYLAKTQNRKGFKPVWVGTLLAVLTSVVAGAAIYFTAGELQGRAEEIFEGTAILIATAVLTWMIFWMRRQARNIKQELQVQIDSAISNGSSAGLFMMAYVAVVREGIETAVFLFAASTGGSSTLQSAVGGVIGLAAAIVLGYIIYKGSSKLNLRTFFNVTGLFLLLFAAGLLIRGIGEFHEAGIIPPVIEHVWDISRVLPDDSGVGAFLSSLFGYTANPSLVQVIAYPVFLAAILAAYLYRPKHKEPVQQ